MEPRNKDIKTYTEIIAPFFQKNQKIIFLLLLLLSNILIFFPYHDLQPMLAQGDHGRDLYGFTKTLEGAVPYRDYWWEYGPLIPYYYALFFKLFGTNIQSILWGQIFLVMVSNMLFYLALAVFFRPFFAVTAALWFSVFNPQFAHTYNHIGGICAILGIILAVLGYIQNAKRKYLYWGIFLAFTLSLIKLNVGLFNFFAFVLSIFWIEYIQRRRNVFKERYFVLSILLFFLSLFFVYWFLFRGLPPYILQLSLPQMTPYYFRTIHIGGPFLEWTQYLYRAATKSWANIWISVLIVLSAAQAFLILFKSDREDSKKYFLFISILSLFFVLNLHEFLVSDVFYRVLWSFSALILLAFSLVMIATARIPSWIRNLFLAALIFLCAQTIMLRYQRTSQAKTPSQYLAFDRAKIYVRNPEHWVKTVTETTRYLASHLKKDEEFLAIPADPLYYFLSERNSPVRQLVFGEYLFIPPQEEQKIIHVLEDKNINYVLLSSAQDSRERGTGTFGKTYCPLLGKYVFSNFTEVARFGDWENEPTWSENHGTKIYKRIQQVND